MKGLRNGRFSPPVRVVLMGAVLLAVVLVAATLTRRYEDSERRARLCDYALRGNIAALEAALNGGASKRDLSGTLWCAISRQSPDQIQIIKLLVARGADVNGRSALGFSMLDRAITAGAPAAVLHILLQHGADVVYGRFGPPLVLAALVGRADVVALLLRYGADVNAADPDTGMTALMEAVDRDQATVANLLLRSGADLDRRNLRGQTALDIAKTGRHTHLVRALRRAVRERGGRGRESTTSDRRTS